MRYFGNEKIVEKKERNLEYIRCDCCNKKVENYFKVTTSHNDWGRDSCDSIETKEICISCIDEFLSSYIKEMSDTGDIEIEKKRICYEYPRYDYSSDELSENDEFKGGTE